MAFVGVGRTFCSLSAFRPSRIAVIVGGTRSFQQLGALLDKNVKLLRGIGFPLCSGSPLVVDHIHIAFSLLITVGILRKGSSDIFCWWHRPTLVVCLYPQDQYQLALWQL